MVIPVLGPQTLGGAYILMGCRISLFFSSQMFPSSPRQYARSRKKRCLKLFTCPPLSLSTVFASDRSCGFPPLFHTTSFFVLFSFLLFQDQVLSPCVRASGPRIESSETLSPYAVFLSPVAAGVTVCWRPPSPLDGVFALLLFF